MATPSQALGLSSTRAQTDALTCDLRTTVIANLMDAINAAWNGWESACKFDDEDMQDYYMKYINTLSDTLKKVRKF